MRIKRNLLNSKIARRVMIMFIGCSLVPIISLTVLSYIKVTTHIVEQNQQQLLQETKAYGLYFFGKLLLLETVMKFITSEINSDLDDFRANGADHKNIKFVEGFNSFVLFTNDNEFIPIMGQIDRPPSPNEAEIRYIRTGKSVLKIDNQQNLSSRMFMLGLADPNNPGAGLLMGEINSNNLLGFSEEGVLPPNTRLVIFDHNNKAFHNNRNAAESYNEALRYAMINADGDQFIWGHNNQEVYSSAWPVFLKFHFLVPHITITLNQTGKELFSSVNQFIKIFWLVILMTLAGVTLLSVFFIKKYFKPLEKLNEATRRIAEGEFDHQVIIKSNDEFEELAESFNSMTLQLGTQFKNINTLAETGMIASNTLFIEKLIKSMLDLIEKKLDFNRGIILLHAMEPFQIKLAETYGYNDDLKNLRQKAFHLIDSDAEKYFMLASSPQAPFFMNDISDIQNLFSKKAMEYAAKMQVQAVLCAPISYNNEILGSIILENPRLRREITQNDLDLLIGIAAHIAGSIFNAHTFSELHRKERALNRSHKELEKRVKERTAEISDRNKELKKENFRRRQMEKALKRAKNESDMANRTKTTFLANMSHELRTPLNHILGFTELILDKHFGELNETQSEYLSDVYQSSRHLLSLINDILDLAKVESGKQELELADVNLKLLLENSLVMVKEKAFKHAIHLSLDIADLPDSIDADERMLKQIIYNLLSNAIKFTPDKGKISITARRCKLNGNDGAAGIGRDIRGIRISVADTGIGLRKEDLEFIFNPFDQVENSSSRRFQGTGLGLSLSKTLVELHGGKIWAESDGLEKGTTLNFIMPA